MTEVETSLSLTNVQSRSLAAQEPDVIRARREKAFAAFESTPMPGRRDEIWRRVELGQLNLEAASARAPFGKLCTINSLPQAAASQGIVWSTAENALRKHAPL